MPSAEPERRLTTYEDLLPGRNGGVGAPGISGEVDIASPEFWILGCVCHLRSRQPLPSRERVPRKSTPAECSELVSEPLGSALWASSTRSRPRPQTSDHASETDHAHTTGIRSGHGDTQHPRGGLLVSKGFGMRRRGPASRGCAASGAPRGSQRAQGARSPSGASKLPRSWAAGRGRGRSGRR